MYFIVVSTHKYVQNLGENIQTRTIMIIELQLKTQIFAFAKPIMCWHVAQNNKRNTLLNFFRTTIHFCHFGPILHANFDFDIEYLSWNIEWYNIHVLCERKCVFLWSCINLQSMGKQKCRHVTFYAYNFSTYIYWYC